MRHLDLFSGIGGFALAARWVGWQTIGFCEIDSYCQKVLTKHWPGVPIHDDIKTYTGTAGSADVITGGFPCQDISCAGKGAGIEGARSGLWSWLARIISEVRPRYAVLENVSALLGRGLDRVTGDLAKIGYDCEWHCIPASAIGAPHRRDRIWIIAHAVRSELRNEPGRGNGPSRPGKTLPTDNGSAQFMADAHQPRLEGRLRRILQERAERKRVGGRGESIVCNPYHWLIEPDVGRVAHGVSAELDFIGRIENELSNSQKTDTETIRAVIGRLLREMWEYRTLAATSPDAYRQRLRDCVPEMSYSDSCSGWLVGARAEENQGLCDLWEAFCAKPQQEAQDLQQKLLERIRKTKRPQALGSRVDRLKGLGNAIVPQVAQIIFEAINILEDEGR